jgi:hypothetical protein
MIGDTIIPHTLPLVNDILSLNIKSIESSFHAQQGFQEQLKLI